MIKSYECLKMNISYNSYLTIQETIYECLKKAIIQKNLPDGERLIEKQLSEIFNTSRTPVRLAIKRLEHENLVTIASGQGAVVCYMTLKEVSEVFMLRESLEGLIIESVIKNMNVDTRDFILQKISHQEELLEKKNKKRLEKAFEEWHESLYKLAGLPRTEEMLKKLDAYVQKFRQLSIESDKRYELAIKEHKAIANAIIELNLDEAMKMNKQHLDQAKMMVIKSLNVMH